MRKFTQSARYLRYNQRHAKKSLAARLRFKRYRRDRNRFESHLSKEARGFYRQNRQKKHLKAIGYVEIKAPTVLSFVQNPDGVSEFISELRNLENLRHPAFIILKDVKEIDYDGITVLLSAVVRFQTKRIALNGDFPNDPTARNIIVESGFFNYINDYKFKNEDHYELTATKIYTHAKKNVDSILGQKIIESSSRIVWGVQKRCPGIQRVFLELMQNTNNHASFDRPGEKHWWLSVKHIQAEKRVTFSFVDYGVGVFNSLRNKKPNDKFYGVFEQLYARSIGRMTGNSDTALLPLIFQGELHRTATGKTYRGKGLPGIYQALQRNQISNLAMITNNVVYNSKKGTYLPLSVPFDGTFVYWELTNKNSNLD